MFKFLIFQKSNFLLVPPLTIITARPEISVLFIFIVFDFGLQAIQLSEMRTTFPILPQIIMQRKDSGESVLRNVSAVFVNVVEWIFY